MIFKGIKKITGLLMMTSVISLAIFAGDQEQQQDPPKKDPPKIVVNPKNERPPQNNNRGNEPRNDNKPKKP